MNSTGKKWLEMGKRIICTYLTSIKCSKSSFQVFFLCEPFVLKCFELNLKLIAKTVGTRMCCFARGTNDL